jgi:hypothetical protein
MAASALKKTTPANFVDNEPTWEMVSSPVEKTQIVNVPSQPILPTTPLRVESKSQKTESRTRTTSTDQAQVGIARQVSVSRAKNANIVKPKLLSPERLVDRKPMTPTLVELSKNRKSQRVQIEDA